MIGLWRARRLSSDAVIAGSGCSGGAPARDVRVVHISTPEGLRRWVAEDNSNRPAVFLLDHEILGSADTGLGLPFCKLAVELLRGRIGVDSRPGEATTFWIRLPRAA